MVLFKFQQAFVPHPAQLLGEGAAVKVEVIGHLLAVEGNLELRAVGFCRLRGKVGQQPSPHRLGRGAEDTLGKAQVLAHGNGQQIVQQRAAYPGGHPAVGERTRVQEQHFAVLGGNGVHHQSIAAEGVGLGKGLPGIHTAQDAFGAPEVEVFDVDGAFDHHADLLHPASGAENDLVSGKCFPAQEAGGGELIGSVRGQPPEQGRSRQHKNPLFVVITTDVSAQL